MTTTPPDGADATTTTTTQVREGPRVTREEIRDLGRLRRTTGPHRNIAGVAGGLARHLDVDPVILRVAFVVLVFFGGAGLVLYVACWLLVPDDTSTSAPLGLDDRSRTVGLVVAGTVAALALLGSSLGDGFVPFPLVVLAGVALLVVLKLNKRKGAGAVPVTHPAAAAAAGPAYGTVTLDKSPPVAWVPPPARVNPRKRGPILFWFTMALCALGVGLLGVLDLAGAAIPGPAYPGLVVGVIGAMLVLGSFWGRAGGLVLAGLVATFALVGAIAAQEIDADSLRASPSTAAQLEASYALDTGELVIDLRGVTDLAGLGGRTLDLTNHVGRIEVIVPAGLDVTAAAGVSGPGSIEIFDDQQDGIDLTQGHTDADTTAPDLAITADLDVGEILIRRAQTFERTNR